MFGIIATSATAAAPLVGSALVAGGKAVAGMAVAAKATQFAQGQVSSLLEDLELAKQAAQEAKADAEATTDEFNPFSDQDRYVA